MDICLNVSNGPPDAASKMRRGATNFFKPEVKRMMKKSLREDSKTKKQSKGVSEVETKFGKTMRVKQKSLAAIVANNVARSKTAPVRTDGKAAKNDFAATRKTQPSLLTASREKSAGEPLVAFTKPSNENMPKTIVAKRRSVVATDSKKSLGAIFSKSSESSETETKLLPMRPKIDGADEEIITTKPQRFGRPGKAKRRDNDGPSRFRKIDDGAKSVFPKSEDFPKREKQNHNKSSSKVSSLFGNNPEVPNIGQRFVKPVNESVFSETTFADLGIHDYAISNLEQNMKITKMTTVQQKAIPIILSGRNVLVRSQTGSGKTLAYGLPIVERLQKIRPKLLRNCGLRALIVVPTRELALQTYECFLKLVKPFTWIVAGYLVGGEKRKAEKARLRRGCAILIATPGRLLDHIKHTEALTLENVECFVLDEADRMLDMGYEKDISEIVEALKASKTVENEKSGYDPLQLIRNRGKKIDSETSEKKEKNGDNCLEKNCEEEKSIDGGNVDTDNDEEEEEEEGKDSDDEDLVKAEYHSGTDSDSDDQEFPIRTKKINNNFVEKSSERLENKSRDENDESKENADSEIRSDCSRQTILLSATLTSAVEKLAGLTMTNPVLVDAAKENLTKAGGNLNDANEDLVVPQGVVQSYVVTPPKLRMVTLSAYIAGKCQAAGQHKILVFMATQDMIDYHAEILSKILGKPRDDDDEDSDPLVDVEFFKLHGSMSQKERTDVFKTFRKARSGVLLCTDVAARGLDMPKVDTVVQYTGPLSARDYVHRIGRTARAGTCGVSTIFLTPPEIEFVRMLESRRIRIKQESMNDVLDKLMGPLSKHRTVEATATALQNEFESLVIDNKRFHTAACKAYVSWIRFYASYPRDMREIFNRKDLHLGHYAKSFALRDPPQKIGGIGKTLRDNEPSKPQHNNRLSNERPVRLPQKERGAAGASVVGGGGHKPGMLKRSRMLNTSEYGSGLESIKKSKKTL